MLWASAEQIAVRSRAFETDMRTVCCQRVNQNPIRRQMAIAAAGKMSAQGMVFVFRRQLAAFNQQVHDRPKFREFFAALAGTLDIFLELAGAAESSHKPKSA